MRKNIAYILVGIITFLNCCTAALAADAAGFECSDVQKAGTAGLYVVLEEPIASTADKNNIFCFRACQKEIEGGKRICTYEEKCPTTEGTTCQRIQVIRANSGTELIYNYVGMIYKWAAGTVGIISVFVMVFGGVEIITAGADSAKIENAKKHIMQSLSGLVILFLSGLILYTINPTFFV